jgi:hypothetical protein
MQTRLRWRLWWSLSESVWRESRVRLSVLRWHFEQETYLNRREDVSTFNLACLMKTFDKLCTFHANCEDNVAINCVTVKHKNRLISVNFYGLG